MVTPLEPGNEMPLFEMMVRHQQINRFLFTIDTQLSIEYHHPEIA